MTAEANRARFFDLAAALPEHLVLGADAAQAIGELPCGRDIDDVTVLGMGTGRTAGLVVRALAAPVVPIPILVESYYQPPAYIGERSLIIALSGSGNTDEVNHAAAACAGRGASLVVVTTNGWLADFALDHGAPLLRIPAEIRHPRATFGVMVGSLIAIFEQISLLSDASLWIDGAVVQLRRRREELCRPGSIAEQLAGELIGRHVICQGEDAVGAAAAARWKAQLNQNARQPASVSIQPDASHNEAVAWDDNVDLTRREVAVLLRHPYEDPRAGRLMDLWEQYVRGKISVHTVLGEGDTRLAALLDLIMVGEFTSLHLATVKGLDPSDVRYISHTVKEGITPPVPRPPLASYGSDM